MAKVVGGMCRVSASRWYVIQVSPGQEDRTCFLIGLAADGQTAGGRPVLEECFTPRYQVERKFHGVYRTLHPTLFPGYVVAITRDVERLNRLLRTVPSFTRVLGIGTKFVPLDSAEQAFIDAFTTQEHRLIQLSRAVVSEGDHIRIIEGPLVSHEGWITKINRRKGTARIETDMFGRTLNIEIGLVVLAKQ